MTTINFEAEKRAYKKFIQAGMTPAGACGLIGNLQAESDGFYPNRVEYLCIKRLKENGKSYTDESYTAAVDNGKISCEEFLHPLAGKQYGYGLAQWTSPGRKAGLWNLAKQKGVSIANEDMQIEYLLKELQESYGSVLKVLKTATSIREASDIVLKKFEIPANTGESVCAGRAARGQKFYDSYAKGEKKVSEVQQKKESAISWMENTANDNSHGYDQDNRWGPDYDCSSATIEAWEQSGVPVKTKGATYTGNMRPVFLKNGFEDITAKVNLATGEGLERSDVLLNEIYHVAMYCGNGKEVEASINEKGTAHGGRPGDQTGKEFLIRSYRNYPWTHVLRYTGGETAQNAERNYLMKGDTGAAVKTMQLMLIDLRYSCGTSGADGDFGDKTDKALKKFQKANGLEDDGKYGPLSKAKLVALHNAKTSGTGSSASKAPTYTVGKIYTTAVDNLRVRKGAGTDYSAKKWQDLTKNAREHAYTSGELKKGTEVSCLEIKNDSAGNIWMRIPSGWIAAYYKKKKYVQ